MKLYNSITWISRVSLVVIVLLLGCSKDNPQPTGTSADFTEYINRFVAEGKARNVSVDISNLIVEYIDQVTISGSPYCGQSLPGSVPHVQITKSAGCWSNQTDVNKEILIFHELGHALLKRSHYDFELQNGLWVSLMHSGNQFNLYNEFEPALRSYYLDELFNPNTPLPVAVLPKSNSKIVLSDSISITNNWTFHKTVSSLNHVESISNTNYVSAHHSLSIQAPAGGVTDGFSYWVFSVDPSGITTGSELELKVKVKLDNVTTGGVSIVLRGDVGGSQGFFKTTQGVVDIKGTQNFTEYTVSQPYFPAKVSTLYIFLVFFGNSTGTVYFDDVTLINKY
jgi:hypothetical protein